MQLIIKNGTIIATHEDHQDVADRYPGCECVSWGGALPHQGPEDPPLRDPRTKLEKLQAYKDKRRNAYPSTADQLDMLYHDKKNGTTTWTDAIDAVKIRYPSNT